jgi:hypothetical protein
MAKALGLSAGGVDAPGGEEIKVQEGIFRGFFLF